MSRPWHTRLAAERARELRKEMTAYEAILWRGLRRRATGARFRRQVPIGHWIVDFASFDPPVVIEVDDESHDFRDEEARTASIERLGFTILRFDNEGVRTNADAIVQFIADEVGRLRNSPGEV